MDYAWLLPIITPALSFVGGLWGASLRAYSTKKGENLATREDIGDLTKIAKNIEFEISEKVWNRQKRWELKREILFQASKNLAEVDELMIWFHSMMRNPQNPNRADDAVAKLVDRWNRAAAGLYETKNLADIVCHFDTREAFMTLAIAANEYEQAVEKRDALLYEQTFKNLRDGLAAAKAAVRKELGIDDAGKTVDSGRG